MSSSLSVYALCVVVLFAKMLAVSCYQGYFRLRLKAFVNPEDAAVFQRPARATEHPKVVRASRVWANDLENIPVFFALGGLAIALDTSAALCTSLFVLFTLARILHTLAYLARWQPWRTLFYSVATACLLGLCTMVTVTVLETLSGNRQPAGAAFTPSSVAKEMSLAVSRKSLMYGTSSVSLRTAANSVACKPSWPRCLAIT